jgi:hypothetical protein
VAISNNPHPTTSRKENLDQPSSAKLWLRPILVQAILVVTCWDDVLFGRVKGKRLLVLGFQAESLKQRAFRDEVQQTLDSTWGTGETSWLEVVCQYDCKQQAGILPATGSCPTYTAPYLQPVAHPKRLKGTPQMQVTHMVTQDGT